MGSIEEGKSRALMLMSDPSIENWSTFENWLRRSRKVTFYKVNFKEGETSSEQDLLSSYVSIYDLKKNEIFRVPIYCVDSEGEISGAVYHLRNLVRMDIR